MHVLYSNNAEVDPSAWSQQLELRISRCILLLAIGYGGTPVYQRIVSWIIFTENLGRLTIVYSIILGA